MNPEQLAEYQKLKQQQTEQQQKLEDQLNANRTGIEKDLADARKINKDLEAQLRVANSKPLLDSKAFTEKELEGYTPAQITALLDYHNKMSKTGKATGVTGVSRTATDNDTSAPKGDTVWDSVQGKFVPYNERKFK